MPTWLDQQIEQLETIVGKQFDSYETMCTVNRCVLLPTHGNSEPHISLADFFEMQVRNGARIFADRASRPPRRHVVNQSSKARAVSAAAVPAAEDPSATS
jgi:hypothetical protein